MCASFGGAGSASGKLGPGRIQSAKLCLISGAFNSCTYYKLVESDSAASYCGISTKFDIGPALDWPVDIDVVNIPNIATENKGLLDNSWAFLARIRSRYSVSRVAIFEAAQAT